MKTAFYTSLVLAAASWAGCSDNSATPTPTVDMASAGDMTTASTFPAAPTIGAQIDRMGRPGVNTALTDPFWDTTGDGMTGLDAHHAKQDAYNQASDPAMWGAKFGAQIKASAAVFDSLDQDLVAAGTNSCGNQLAYGALSMPDYTVLGSVVLPDDELYVNTANTTCKSYLAVEAATLGSANTDCGGRTPTEDVIDVTYAVLAGTEVLSMNPLLVLNGVAKDTDGTVDEGTFPFLAAPLN